MGMRTEEKILDEIRKRVIEKDTLVKEQKEIDALRKANQEALSDLTSLSKTDIELIAKDVRIDFQNKKRKKQSYVTFGIIILAVIILIYANRKKQTTNKISTTTTETVTQGFYETFDDNKNNWSLTQDINYKREFDTENKQYIFETNEESYCYWDDLKFAAPQKFTVEVTSVWLKGKYEEYGINLLEDANNFHTFLIKGDGTASYAERRNDKWTINEAWWSDKANVGDGIAENVQKMVYEGDKIKYYINDKFIYSAANSYKISAMSLRVCNTQTIAFRKVRITDDVKKKVIIDDNFTNPSDEWNPANKWERLSEIKNGFYNLKANKEDQCYWGKVEYTPTMKNYDVNMKLKWIKGETANFGLMLMLDEHTYVGYELQNDGKGRYIISESGTYTKIETAKSTGVEINPGTIINFKIKVRDDEFEYFVNDKSVSKAKMGIYEVKMIGLRNCGRQEIDFDELSVVPAKD